MFKKINIKDKVVIKVDLYKNRREKIAEIPLDYIEKITYKFADIDEIQLTIPKYTDAKNEKRLGKLISEPRNSNSRQERKVNHIYSKINTRQQIVVTTISIDGTKKKQRFTLYDRNIFGSRNNGNKSFTAYSWEKTLEKQRISIEQLSRQLTNKGDSVHISEGILDLICKKTGWKVGYIDPKARTTISTVVESFNVNLLSNHVVNKVGENGLIFEKDVDIKLAKDKSLYLQMNYADVKTYDTSGNVISNMNIVNNLTEKPFSEGIKKVQAYHLSDTGNRFGIRYVFTLTSGIKTERTATFTNCISKKLSISKIALEYDYADLVEKENVQYANFEAFDDSALKFLKDIEEVFECTFIYDTMNNTINAYARESLNENKGYLLSVGHNVVDVQIKEDTDVITALKVESDNDISIANENPNGTTIIENYSYYIRNELISYELQEALERYSTYIQTKQDEWSLRKEERHVCQQKYTKASAEAYSLQERIKNLNLVLTECVIKGVNSDGLRVTTKEEIKALETQYTKVLATMSAYNTELANIDDKLTVISKAIQKENATDSKGKIFTSEDLQELLDMLEVDTYSDSYYTTSYGLYNYAKKYLEEKSKPNIEFNLSCENLCSFIKNINGWDYILEMGTLFNLEKDEVFNDIEDTEIRLTQMDLIPIKGTETVMAENFAFTNKINKTSTLKVGANIGKSTNKTNGIVSNFRTLWEDSKTTNNFVGDMISSGLNIAAANIRGGVHRNQLDFSEAGCFIINNDNGNTDNQIYLGGGTIAITTDGWVSSDIAVDSEGLVSEQLYGRILLGENLYVSGDHGLFYVGEGNKTQKEFGMFIYDTVNNGKMERVFLGTSLDDDGVKRAKLRLTSQDGKEVVLSDEGILQANQFVMADNVDATHPMIIPFRSIEGTSSYKEVVLTLDFYPYRAFETGASGGGGFTSAKTVTSKSGGGTAYGKATGGGGYSSKGVSSNLQNYYSPNSNVQKFIYSGNVERDPASAETSPNNHYHAIYLSDIAHTHSFTVTTPEHTHNYSVDVPSHTHDIELSVSAGSHSHALIYGIKEDATPSYVSVYINGEAIGGIGNHGTIKIPVNKIKIGGMNEIKISNNGNGRIVANVAAKFWQRW